MSLYMLSCLILNYVVSGENDYDMQEVCDDTCLQSESVYIHPDELEFSFKNYPAMVLPKIDFYTYLHGNDKEKDEIIKSFDYYLSTIGSVIITNHGIPTSILEEAFMKNKQFFAKPLEYKLRYKHKGAGTSGYVPWGSYSGAKAYGIPDQPPDLAEDFAMYNNDVIEDENNKKWINFAPKKEHCPPELYNISRKYIPKIQNVLKILWQIASLSLGLNEDYFYNQHKNTPNTHLRFFNYPPLNLSALLPKQMRVSQHKDFLSFTLLTEIGRGIQMKFGNMWLDIKKDNKYDLILNIGELTEFWTNGHWKSLLHRVIPLANSKKSISFLIGPDQDIMIEPIKDCKACTKEPQKYMSRTAAQHGQMRYGTVSRS